MLHKHDMNPHRYSAGATASFNLIDGKTRGERPSGRGPSPLCPPIDEVCCHLPQSSAVDGTALFCGRAQAFQRMAAGPHVRPPNAAKAVIAGDGMISA